MSLLADGGFAGEPYDRQPYAGMGPCRHGDGCIDLVHLRAVEAARIANGRERDIYKREVERLRQGLLACATESGADVSDGIPTLPDIVDWAVGEVRRLRSDYEESGD